MASETVQAFHSHDDVLVAMLLLGEDPFEEVLRPLGVGRLDVYECPVCGEQVSFSSAVPAE